MSMDTTDTLDTIANAMGVEYIEYQVHPTSSVPEYKVWSTEIGSG